MQENLKSDKMGYAPVGKLLIRMALPAMLSMFVQALYNIVDSIFIGRYDPGATLTAVNLAMPFQTLPLAFALGVGVGTNAIVSKSLGENDREKASFCARTGFLIAVVCYVVFIFVGIFLSPVYAGSFSEGDGEVAELTTRYLQIVVSLSLFSFVEILFNKVLQATGNMIVPMISQLIGACVNILLDPLFINGYWIFPELGIVGAAVATVVGQACAMVYVVCVFFFRKQDVSFRLKGFRIKKEYIAGILTVGVSTTVLNGLASVTTIVMYAILADLTAKTVLGLYFKVQSFVFMPVFGLNQGAMPIMSYNFGRGDRKRFLRVYRLAVTIASAIMLIGMTIFLTVPDGLLALFNVKEGALLTMGERAFSIVCFSFFPAAFGIITITMLQSTQNGLFAMTVAFCRQLMFLIPCALLIKAITGDAFLDYIWWCYPVSEFLALCLSLPVGRIMGIRAFKKVFLAKENSSALKIQSTETGS